MSPFYIPFATISFSSQYTDTFHSTEKLLSAEPYQALDKHTGSGTIAKAHVLEIKTHFGSYYIDSYVVTLMGFKEMTKIPIGDIGNVSNSGKVVSKGKEALESLEKWSKAATGCLLSEWSYGIRLPHPHFEDVTGIFEAFPSPPEGRTVISYHDEGSEHMRKKD